MNEKEKLLDRMIALYGYEHKAVIQFAELIERGAGVQMLRTLVETHEAYPLYTLDEED